jgi:ABC-type phosphate transport system substrate-binding protein
MLTRSTTGSGAPETSRRLALRTLSMTAIGAALVAVCSDAVFAQQAAPPPFQIVVHPRNPAALLSREFLNDAFLKKTTRWGDGEGIRPVDLEPRSATRQKFSEAVLKRSIAAVRSYWQQRIFSGRELPPPELDSDEAVLDYVLKNRGAVGYVSGHAKVADVKVIAVR